MTNNDISIREPGPRVSTKRVTKLTWWMRVVGVFYLLQFVMMAIVRAPIRTVGPAGALDRADAGDPLASFLVDTWVTFGLEVGAIGVALLFASRHPRQSRGLVWAVLAIEVGRGIVADIYLLARGNSVSVYATWIVIHTLVIVTGLLVLRTRPEKEENMPLFMDVHTLDGGVSVGDVANAHLADLATQGTYGVEYRRYWVDEGAGKIFCLVEAPDAEAANRVHREAHGLVADEIYQVSEHS